MEPNEKIQALTEALIMVWEMAHLPDTRDTKEERKRIVMQTFADVGISEFDLPYSTIKDALGYITNSRTLFPKYK